MQQQMVAQQQQQLEYQQQNLQQQLRMQQQQNSSTPSGSALPGGYYMHPQSPLITNDGMKPQVPPQQTQVGTPGGGFTDSESGGQQPHSHGSFIMSPAAVVATNSHQHSASPNNMMMYSQQQMHRSLNQQNPNTNQLQHGIPPGSNASAQQSGGQQSQMFAHLTDFADNVNVDDLISSIPGDGE